MPRPPVNGISNILVPQETDHVPASSARYPKEGVSTVSDTMAAAIEEPPSIDNEQSIYHTELIKGERVDQTARYGRDTQGEHAAMMDGSTTARSLGSASIFKGESIFPGPSERSTSDQSDRASSSKDEAKSDDKNKPEEASTSEENYNNYSSRQLPMINIFYVSNSAVAIGGGAAHVHLHK